MVATAETKIVYFNMQFSENMFIQIAKNLNCLEIMQYVKFL